MPLLWEANSSFWLQTLKTSELAYQNPLFSLFDAPEGVEGLMPEASAVGLGFLGFV